jgi:hypothetical protein
LSTEVASGELLPHALSATAMTAAQSRPSTVR